MNITQGLRRAARRNGKKTAVIDGSQNWNWSEFENRVARLAGAFQSLGMKENDRVSILSRNTHRQLEYFFGTIWGGGIAVPINHRWAIPEISDALKDCGSKILLVDQNYAALVPKIRAAGVQLDHVIYADEGIIPEGLISYEEVMKTDPIADYNRGYDDLATLFYTGGTTGRSKGVMLTHNNIMCNSMTGIANMGFTTESRHLHVGPLFHLASASRIFSMTTCGGCHVILPQFDPLGVLQQIQEHQVTHVVFVPTMMTMLVNHPDIEQYDLSSLQLIAYGASSMPDTLIRRCLELIPNVQFLQSYGMTETSPVLSVLKPKYHVTEGPNAGYMNSVGQATYHVDVKIVDEQGQEKEANELGEVLVRGPMVMKGYWGLPELTKETIIDGWLHTGDAGYLDENQFLYIVDRIKDMIISGGENVYSTEVESVIYEHPAIQECAVIGVPDEKWMERVHAVVVLKAGETLNEEELIAHCRERIGGYKIPRSVEFRTDPLPLSGARKILKTVLREEYINQN